MKIFLLSVMILIFAELMFSQKIVLHRNSGGNEIFQLSSVDSITFLPFTCGDDVRYGGQTYHTVLIGSQCWMKENLNVGTRINGDVEQINNSTIEKYCYDNDTANCTIYGGLYQWNEVMQYVTTQGTKGICPDGWHIPTQTEFQTLQATVGNDGNALKREDQGVAGGIGTNTSGFSALLSGYRYLGGIFNDLLSLGFFYTSTEGGSTQAYYMYLQDSNSNISYYNNNKLYGMSVRCIKNE